MKNAWLGLAFVCAILLAQGAFGLESEPASNATAPAPSSANDQDKPNKDADQPKPKGNTDNGAKPSGSSNGDLSSWLATIAMQKVAAEIGAKVACAEEAPCVVMKWTDFAAARSVGQLAVAQLQMIREAMASGQRYSDQMSDIDATTCKPKKGGMATLEVNVVTPGGFLKNGVPWAAALDAFTGSLVSVVNRFAPEVTMGSGSPTGLTDDDLVASVLSKRSGFYVPPAMPDASDQNSVLAQLAQLQADLASLGKDFETEKVRLKKCSEVLTELDEKTNRLKSISDTLDGVLGKGAAGTSQASDAMAVANFSTIVNSSVVDVALSHTDGIGSSYKHWYGLKDTLLQATVTARYQKIAAKSSRIMASGTVTILCQVQAPLKEGAKAKDFTSVFQPGTDLCVPIVDSGT